MIRLSLTAGLGLYLIAASGQVQTGGPDQPTRKEIALFAQEVRAAFRSLR